MTQSRDCPVCFGSGKIRITDYVEHELRYNWEVPCPLCMGARVIRTADALWEWAR